MVVKNSSIHRENNTLEQTAGLPPVRVFQLNSSVLESAVRVADETSNRTIECPVLAQRNIQSYIRC